MFYISLQQGINQQSGTDMTKKTNEHKVLAKEVEQILKSAINFHQTGQLSKAKVDYETILKHQPTHPRTLVNLGLLEHQLGNSTLGLEHINKGLAVEPNHAKFLLNKGVVLQGMKQYRQAIECYHQATEIAPNSADGFNNLGACYKEIDQFEKAMTNCKKAIELNPAFAEAHLNVGAVYQCYGDNEKAKNYYLDAIELGTQSSKAYSNLGSLYLQDKQHEDAIQAFKQALALAPNDYDAYISLARCYEETCHFDECDKMQDSIVKLTATEVSKGQKTSLFPFWALSRLWPSGPQKEVAQSWSQHTINQIKNSGENPHFAFSRKTPKKLRIGYLSMDFRDHTVAHLTYGLYAGHNRDQFEVFCYSYCDDDNSLYRKHIKESCDHFVDIKDLSDLEAAKKIHQDGINILIDLTGYTSRAREGVLVYKPAPIIVNYLGFLGSLGMPQVDYIITDEIVTPPQLAKDYTEKFVYMPHSYQINSHQHRIAKMPTRKDCGLPEDAFVFCSFVNNYKIEKNIFITWMKILAAAPNSVLWLRHETDLGMNNLKRYAKQYGVDPDRLIFAPAQDRANHIARHQCADVFLDSFCVNARTSGGDALWAGLPILTCSGEIFGNRVGASLLSAIGLQELVTPDLETYALKALHLAKNPQETVRLKKLLAANKVDYPLYDTPLFIEHLEKAYHHMWRLFHNEIEPTSFKVGKL